MNDPAPPSGFVLTQPQGAVRPAALSPDRYPSLDVARGVIMILMALDHASMLWNAGRPTPCLEGAVGLPPVEYANWAQQLIREVTHVCAPGFQFLAGMGLAISVWRRERRGQSQWAISADMVLRGLVLCFCDFVLMYYVYGRIPLFFVVLACIGCSIIAFSVLRLLPEMMIAVLSLATILAAPLYCQDAAVQPSAAGYPVNILFNVTLGQPWAYWVMYPVFPWIACFGLGWCLGRRYERGHTEQTTWLTAAGAGLIVGTFFLRWFGGEYADRIPSEGGPASAAFWAMSKYPPSPVFLLSTLGMMAVMIGSLRYLDFRAQVSRIWWIPVIYGRVALFFYLTHMYVYAAYPVFSGTVSQYGLAMTCVVWPAGLAVLIPPCLLYHRVRSRYRRILRYF